MDAAERWREQLAGWAIPRALLEAAPRSPWGFSVDGFRDRADRQRHRPHPGHEAARAALRAGGTVADVGCGAGAGSLPLVPPAGALVGVDESAGMLAAYREAGEALGATVTTLEGSWPGVASRLGDDTADVVVAQDVAYNVADLAGLAREATRVAARRVVLVLPTRHPMAWTAPYWHDLHGLDRPDGPTVDDALAVAVDLGLDVRRADWTEPTLWAHAPTEQAVELVRTRLCLGPDRDDDVRRSLAATPPPSRRDAVSLWWDAT